MKISVKRTNDNYRMEATNENGNQIVMDASKNIGGEESGFRPTQLLLAAVGGCTAIDVIMILKKQRQEIESFEVEVDGEKEKVEEYSLFRNIVLHYKLKGKIDRDKAERAIQLSLDKYCSVSKTLEPTAKITFRLSLND
jgi:putative redox protein